VEEPLDFADLPSPGAARARDAGCVLVWPIGAVEAHGPHLPLGTDTLLGAEMARRAILRLRAAGTAAYRLPPLAQSVAGYAASFAGTIGVSAATATALVADVFGSLARAGFGRLAIATAHLDPGHLGALRDAVARVKDETGVEPVFPDITRRRLAERLGDEFRSGACHAGRFETSMILAIAPGLVDEARRRALPPLHVSLSEGIRAGKRTFEEMGGREAYFGDPAAATAAEGESLLEELATILVEAIGGATSSPSPPR